MNGDFIAKDVEPEICCPNINDLGCTCELEKVHLEQILKNGCHAINIGWGIDEIGQYITSKVGLPDDPNIYIFTTTQTGRDTWVHAFD